MADSYVNEFHFFVSLNQLQTLDSLLLRERVYRQRDEG